jgi:hypothetical protein
MVSNIDNVQEVQIAPYAPPRAEVREMVARFKAGLTNADKLSTNELLALATASLGHSLNPWNQEIWAIPGKGLMLGIKGLRKVADRQAEKGGFRWWTEFLDIRNKQEAELYDIPAGAIAAKLCILRRSDNIEAYLDNLKNLQGSGLDYDAASQLIGAPPRTIGVGYVMPNEKSEMPIPQRVMKRAEAHAIKQAFSVPFRTEYNVDLEPIEPVGGFAAAEWDVDAQLPDDVPVYETAPIEAATEEDADVIPSFPPGDAYIPDLDGKSLYVLQQEGWKYTGIDNVVHYKNRWRKIYGVTNIKDVPAHVGEFIERMKQPSEA